MEITAIKPEQYSCPRTGVQSWPEKARDLPQEEKGKEEKAIDSQGLESVIRELNKAMEALNTTIQFSLHEETQRMMVKVVNREDMRVIKEFPPKEFLDTIAKIRNMIGVFLDLKG